MMTPELQPTNDANIPTLNDEVTTHTDDALVIELQERGHRQPMAMPLTYWPLVIGRAATADLVLTDASIAPAHIRLHRNDAGAVEVEVLDTTNGVWLNKRHYRAGERFEWSPGQRLSLGRSLQFLLRSSSQPLAATQRWQPSPRGQGFATAAALLAMCGVLFFMAWISATKTGQIARDLPTMLMVAFGSLLVWTLGWSLMSKLFTGWTSFWRHVCIAAVGSVALMALDLLLSAAAFAWSLPILTRYNSVITLVVLALIIWFHLRAATLARPRTLGWIVLALLVLVVGTKLGMRWQSQKQLSDSLYLSTILPPQWRMVPPVAADQFVQDAASIQKLLDRRAKEDDNADEDGDTDESGLD